MFSKQLAARKAEVKCIQTAAISVRTTVQQQTNDLLQALQIYKTGYDLP
ncbi:unnamed protein product [Schistosoma curassoni]|uniref:Methyl-accepting chemotaxis protein n=1 Tax=Schistosoma curassoni TaxID=6186 RepID=A0A183KZQ9_9TREM|nr:unnamed protein product [Schistosoma curassoni]